MLPLLLLVCVSLTCHKGKKQVKYCPFLQELLCLLPEKYGTCLLSQRTFSGICAPGSMSFCCSYNLDSNMWGDLNTRWFISNGNVGQGSPRVLFILLMIVTKYLTEVTQRRRSLFLFVILENKVDCRYGDGWSCRSLLSPLFLSQQIRNRENRK